jgi:hypothetical protein
LNDNLFDIGFLEEFAAYCVQTGSAQLSGIQPLHVRSIHMESAPNLDHFANQFNGSNRGVDPHYADRSLRFAEIERDLSDTPRIRFSRT